MVSYRRLAMRVLGHVPVPFGKKKAAPLPALPHNGSQLSLSPVP